MSKLGDRMGSKLGREARSILEAGRAGDDPTPADRARVKRALMRSIAAGSAIGAASAAASAGAATGAATGGAAAAKAASVGLGIKLFGGVVLALAVGTGVLVQRASEPDPAPAKVAPSAAAPVAATSANAAPATVIAEAPLERPSEPTPSEKVLVPAPMARAAGEPANRPEPVNRASEEEARAEAPAPVTPPAPAANPDPAEDPLAAETRRLREAHGALQAGDAQKALALLDEQGGQLGEERAAARVLALCQMGRVAEAEAARAAFLREHPRSPLAARIQGGCAPSIAR